MRLVANLIKILRRPDCLNDNISPTRSCTHDKKGYQRLRHRVEIKCPGLPYTTLILAVPFRTQVLEALCLVRTYIHLSLEFAYQDDSKH